jgi:hypothetical protein
MAAKSLLLKVSPEVHTGIQVAAGRHRRSMQGVLVVLIERWLAAGGPDPLLFDVEKAQVDSTVLVDPEARQAIEALVERVAVLQEQVSNLVAGSEAKAPGWAASMLSLLGAGEENPQAHVGHLVPPELRLNLAKQFAADLAEREGASQSTAANDGVGAYLKARGGRPSPAAAPLDGDS